MARVLDKIKLLGVVSTLLIPIQKSISVVLPDFVEDAVDEEPIREKIVLAADKALIVSSPEAKLVPKAVRERVIRRSLDILLDEIVLPDNAEEGQL